MLHDNRADPIKISVITVCFNAAEAIAENIQSIRSQSHPDIEYVVVDGGSTNEALAIIAENRDAITLLITGADNGMYDAANKGIDCALAGIVGMLCADGFYADKDVLKDVASVLAIESHAVYGDFHQVDWKHPQTVNKRGVFGLYDRKRFLVG